MVLIVCLGTKLPHVWRDILRKPVTGSKFELDISQIQVYGVTTQKPARSVLINVHWRFLFIHGLPFCKSSLWHAPLYSGRQTSRTLVSYLHKRLHHAQVHFSHQTLPVLHFIPAACLKAAIALKPRQCRRIYKY